MVMIRCMTIISIAAVVMRRVSVGAVTGNYSTAVVNINGIAATIADIITTTAIRTIAAIGR
jgi:hypothetical protein